MKKSLLFIVAFLFLYLIPTYTFAQKIKNDEIKILKEKRSVISAEFDIPKEIMEKVVEDYLSGEGLRKPSKKSGFLVYEKSTFGKISNDIYDYYAKIDGNKEKSTVFFAVSKGYDNFIGQSEGGIYSKFNSVFKNIQEKAQKAYIDNQINEQQKVVDKAKKRHENLINEGKSLQKEKENIENKIINNQKDQEGMKKLLEEEEIKLRSIK